MIAAAVVSKKLVQQTPLSRSSRRNIRVDKDNKSVDPKIQMSLSEVKVTICFATFMTMRPD
jgi:hypothetical protein